MCQELPLTAQKSELGPHAFEDKMPDWLRQQLEAGGAVSVRNTINPADGRLVRVTSVANETPGLVGVVAALLEADRSVARAYLCHPAVVHICKLRREGGFCGYRNIQMLASYMCGVDGAVGSEAFGGEIPGILRLQDLIEHAWDRGFNANGRVETGGIRGTRKYIGTPEVRHPVYLLSTSC